MIQFCYVWNVDFNPNLHIEINNSMIICKVGGMVAIILPILVFTAESPWQPGFTAFYKRYSSSVKVAVHITIDSHFSIHKRLHSLTPFSS